MVVHMVAVAVVITEGVVTVDVHLEPVPVVQSVLFGPAVLEHSPQLVWAHHKNYMNTL